MRPTGRGERTGRSVCMRVPARLRLLPALVLTCLLPCAVSAYTIIMRGGRRVEAPDSFVVTQTTLTYPVARGLNVTWQLSQIDIAATERANNESAGSLLRRSNARSGQETALLVVSTASAQQARRTLTNRELEPARHARLESERAYEAHRKELGLPAPINEQRSAAEETEALHRIARRYAMETAQAENYWRSRAATLRAETVALDAEIDYLRTRVATTDNYAAGSFAVLTPFNPFFGGRPFPSAVPLGSFNANSFGTTTQLGGSIAFGGATRGQILLNQQSASSTFQRRVIGTPNVFAAPVAIFAVPFNYAAADESALRIRLAELEAAHAGLVARWQQLEDEAHRAGALPGWLRP